MDEIIIEYHSAIPCKECYFLLFRSTGWNQGYQLDANQLYDAISHSWFTIAAYVGEQLVGFGRIISDGIHHAFIVDLIVLPEYQGQGIGSTILKKLLDQCEAHQLRDIQLFSARGTGGFYKRFGFEERPLDAPGMQLRRKI